MLKKLCFWLLLPVLGGLMLAQGASAQGFMVKPMTMQANPLPSQAIELPLQIYNTALDGPRTIELRLVDLSQDDQGTWRLVEPGAGEDLSGHASSLAWTSLSESRVEIAPQQPADIMVRLKPPAGARGYYFAGIVAETPIPENPQGIVVRTRFLIPLIIEIRGRTVREHVALGDVAMTYRTDNVAAPTTTTAMSITNSGQTYSRVRGEITIERQDGDLWRVVTRLPVRERGIIPGVTLNLGGDLKRRLPSGAYRLRADLFVDGRRVAPLEKIIQFTGDPNATVAYDATLRLQPGMVDMDVVPGATRTTVLHIENTAALPVKIAMESRTPRALVGVQMGDLPGIALSAQPWTRIEPSAFTLRPNGRQNVRIISSVPREDADQANYYADMVLTGTYEDGQSAGETISTVHLVNHAVPSRPDGTIEKVSLAEAENSKFVAELRFVNIGNVDYEPAAKVSLLSPQGVLVASAKLSGDSGTLLPFGRRTYSGEIDFSDVAPGAYSLVAEVSVGADKPFSRRYVATVTGEKFVSADGRTLTVPSVSLTDPAEAAAGSGKAELESGGQVPLDDQQADP